MKDGASAAESSNIRWWVLALISAVMFGNYYVYDAIGPVADQLERELGFSDTQIGTLNAIYSLPNILLVLIGGLIVDRYGATRVTLATASICLTGAALTAWRGDFTTMAGGRLLFGIGSETMLVAATVVLASWFAAGGVALAMALSLAFARMGSYAADISPLWAESIYAKGWQPPMLLAVGFAALSVVAALLYWWVDRVCNPAAAAEADEPGGERVRWQDVARFGRSYWYILALTVLFYSVIFPFRSTFAIKYFQHAHGLSLQGAALMNSYVFLAAVFATPLFGWLSDRYGRRASSMVFGSLLLPLSFVGVVMGGDGLWMTTVLLGISFSLVPAVLWPAVTKLVEMKRLGTAYGLLFMLQNGGMTVCNVVAGRLNDVYAAGPDNPAGYEPMIAFFASLAVGASLFAIALWRREVGPHSRGLELPGALRP